MDWTADVLGPGGMSSDPGSSFPDPRSLFHRAEALELSTHGGELAGTGERVEEIFYGLLLFWLLINLLMVYGLTREKGVGDRKGAGEERKPRVWNLAKFKRQMKRQEKMMMMKEFEDLSVFQVSSDPFLGKISFPDADPASNPAECKTMRKKGEGKLEDQAWTFGELCTMIRRQRYLWINLGETPGSRDKKPGGGSEQEVWQLAKVIAVKRSIAGYLSVTVRYHAIDFSGYLPNLFCDWLCAHERTFILPSYLGTMLAPFRSVTREDRERALKKSRKLISLLLRPRWMGIRGTSYHLDGIRPPAVRVGNQVQGLAQVSRTIACLEPLRAARRSTLSTLLPYLPMEIWGRERVYMDVAEVYYPPEMDEEQARGLILRLYQASPPSLSELEQGILERCDQFVEVTRPEGSVIEAKIENSASNNPQVPEAGEEAPDEPEEEGSAGQEEGEQAAYLKLLKSEDLGRYLALVQMMALRLALEISLGRDTWGDNIRLPEVPARFGCLQGLLLSSILDRPLFYISDQEGWERLQGQSYPSLSILLVSPRLEGSLPAEAMTHGKRAIFIDLRPEEEEEESSEEGDRAKGSGTGKPPLGIDLDLGSTLPRLIDHFFFTLGERGQSLDLNLDPHQDDLLQTLC